MLVVNTGFMLPMSHRNRTGTLLTRKPPYITIHNTANDDATASGHARYLMNNPTLSCSWHFTVDDAELYQHIPRNERAWHTGTKIGNDTSVGIEICQFTKSARHMKSENNGAWFAAYLMHSFGLRSKDVATFVRTHQSWSGKYCPNKILPHWDEFLKDVRWHLDAMYRQEEEGTVAAVSWLKAHTRDIDTAFIEEFTILCEKHGQKAIQEPINPENSHKVKILNG